MEPIKRVTASTVDVLAALLDHNGLTWGLLIIKATGRPAGTVYPILERLEAQGWITSSWEEDDVRPGPRRRLYEFTTEGRMAALETRETYLRTIQAVAPRSRIRPALA